MPSPRRQDLLERLGVLPEAANRLYAPIWVHAASVGEVLAAEPLVRLLRRERPDLSLLLTTTSLTGRQTARDRIAADAVMLLPADLPPIVGRVFRRLRPSCLLLVETELWPALLRAAARYRVPCAMVSGRISERSGRRYTKLRWLVRPLLADVRIFAMQTPADAERIIAMGADPARVAVTGNLKFARTAGDHDRRPRRLSLPEHRIALVAASTHPGEEQLALEAAREALAESSEALLVIAPRRPERFDAVARQLSESGLKLARRSQLGGEIGDDVRILLLDTVGELGDVLPQARAVYVGGTLGGVGGHNVLEPAACGRPVAFGPDTANVDAQAEALLAAGAAVRVEGAEDLRRHWRRLLSSEAEADIMGARGLEVVRAQSSVAERTMELIRPLLLSHETTMIANDRE